jgi:FkbM family methyltransferase
MKLLFDYIPKIARALSGGSVIRTVWLMVCFWYFALTRKLFGLSSKFKITGRYNNQKIIFHLVYFLDLTVLVEVFSNGEYEWCPVDNPKIIVDLGAHFGDTALYYHARFPEAKIIAVEPAPENYERLIEHTKHIPNIVAVQAAVGASDGVITLNLMPSSLGHSVQARTDATSQVEVRQLTLDTLYAEQGIEIADLIKFDIEGAEFDLFANLVPEQYAKAYIGELHFDLTSVPIEKFKENFARFNFSLNQISKAPRFLFTARLTKG